MKIKVKYHNPTLPRLTHIGGRERSDWIDVRVARLEVRNLMHEWSEVSLPYEPSAGEEMRIYLGFSAELPAGYEAHLAPRSSTFKTYGIIQTNGIGVVDESFKGDSDEWFIPCLAMHEIGKAIEFGERIGQFRIIEKMPEVELVEVNSLDNPNRGGFGSSGNR